MSEQENPRQDHSQDKAPSGKSRRTGTIAMACALAVIAGVAIYYFAFARNQVETDDAYVNGNMVRLTPQVAGTVIAIDTDETQFVQRGQILAQLDPHDNEVALEQAKASLGQTVRDVAQLFTEQPRDAAAVVAAQTQLTQATQDLVFPVIIEPAQTTMNVDGKQIPLVSGMTLTAEIKTESRSAISYILSPLIDKFSTAAHER